MSIQTIPLTFLRIRSDGTTPKMDAKVRLHPFRALFCSRLMKGFIVICGRVCADATDGRPHYISKGETVRMLLKMLVRIVLTLATGVNARAELGPKT